MKYTMINGTKDGRFELICFKNGEAVLEEIFDGIEEANKVGNSWLATK